MAKLTADQVVQIALELQTGKPPSLTTPEANAMRETLKTQIAAIHAKGGQVDLPSEVAG